MMIKIARLTLIIFLLTSSAQAGILKYGINFNHNIRQSEKINYLAERKDYLNPNFNVTYFLENGLNFSTSTNRLINAESKRRAIINNVQFDIKSRIYIDSIGIGYKIKSFNPSLFLANIQAKQRIYNNGYDLTNKKSSIVPAINFSYFMTSYFGVNLVPSLTFYKSRELKVQGISANINFMF